LAAQALDSAGQRTVSLAAGFHRIEIRYEIDPSDPRLVVAAARAGHPPEELNASSLKPRLPRNPRLRAATQALHTMAGWVALLAFVLAIRS
jgi:hypothetical protein